MTTKADITGTIWIDHIAFKEDFNDFEAYLRGSYAQMADDIDGIVEYHAEYTRPAKLDDEEGRQGPFEHEYFQPFARDGHKMVNGRNVWAWDGDKEKPTLTPSFGHGQIEDGWYVHLFLEDGEIDPCGDMALEVR